MATARWLFAGNHRMLMLITFTMAFVVTLIVRATAIAAAGDALATAELLRAITVALMLAVVVNGLYGICRVILWPQRSYLSQPVVNIACLVLAVLLVALQHALFARNFSPLNGWSLTPATGAALWQMLPWLLAVLTYTTLRPRKA